MMNHQLQGKDKAPVDSDLSHNNFLYNTFSSHQRLAHQVGLQQRDPLLMMHDQRRNDNFLAVAVQQQLVASLASAPIQLYPSLGGQSHTMNAADLPGNLLSIAQQNQHNAAALMQRLSGHTNTPNNYFAFGMSPKLVDSLVREATSTTKQPTTTVTQQIPCLARGMATDHNSMTAYFEISSDVSHGQHLYCSHPICRAAGVKFRYCLQCKKPVTKQNFRSRHLHAELGKGKPSLRKAATSKKRPHEDVEFDSTEEEDEEDQESRGEGSKKSLLVLEHDPPRHSKVIKTRLVDSTVSDDTRRPVLSLIEHVSSIVNSSPSATALVVSDDVDQNSIEASPSRQLSGRQDKEEHGSTNEKGRITDPEEGKAGHSGDRMKEKGSMDDRESLGKAKEDDFVETIVESPPKNCLDNLSSTATALYVGHTVDRRRRWVSLLTKRPPKLGGGLESWIAQILLVSDTSRSLPSIENEEEEWRRGSTTTTTTSSSSSRGQHEESLHQEDDPSSGTTMRQKNISPARLEQWITLLDERPGGEEEGCKATLWLTRVLQISCSNFYDESQTCSSLFCCKKK